MLRVEAARGLATRGGPAITPAPCSTPTAAPLYRRVVELVFVDGQWQPLRPGMHHARGSVTVAPSSASASQAVQCPSAELKHAGSADPDRSWGGRSATDSAAGSGRLPPASSGQLGASGSVRLQPPGLASSPSAARPMGRRQPPLMPTPEEGKHEG